MELNFTEEQTMLRDTLASFLADTYGIEERRAALAAAPHWRPDIWRRLAEELGILGAAFPEELGGLGGGATENMIVMEEFGRALVVEPYLSTVVIGGGFLKYAGHPGAADLAEQVIAGEAIIAFAQAERDSRFDLGAVETTACADAGGWVLDGTKKLVLSAPYATHFFVTARTAGAARDRDGVSVFLVPHDAAGITLREYMTFDGLAAADVTFENVRVGAEALFGIEGDGLPLVERVVDEAIAALCGEAVGVMRKMLESTREHTTQRVQFGKPISTFQVLQHRMVDMFMELEQALSMAWLAAIRTGDEPAQRAYGISAAKAQVSAACRKVGQAAIQLHGGMGMTEEMPVSHYFKRATMIETMLGSVDHHLARIERLQDEGHPVGMRLD